MSASSGEVGGHLRRLFGAGSGVGLTDGELLERFAAAARRGEAAAVEAEAAFETILARHGSTVWAVGRQILGDGDAAADAFQATFLVLVRRAGSLRLRDDGSLGAWLHGVAYRTALKARRGTARRRTREHRVARPEAREGSAIAAVDRDDLGAALHAEVARLPAKYRAAVVLCYFEGRTHDEAAAALRWPVGSVRSRLSRAREMLRNRLVRRGLTPAVAAIGAAGTGLSARAEVPAALRHAVLDAAVGGVPAPAVRALAGLVVEGLLAARLRTAAAVLGVFAMAAGLAFALGGATASPSREEPTARAPAPVAAVEPRALDDPLPDHARARLGSNGFRHGDLANQVLYSRDGKTLITLGWKRVVGIWDAATGRLRHEIPLSGDLYEPIALSPDGTTLATTEPNPERRLRLWDVATGRELRRWHVARADTCTSPAFTADGRALITVGSQYEAGTGQQRWFFERWDLTVLGERRRRNFGTWGYPGHGFQVSPDGRTLATMGSRPVEKPPAAANNGFPAMGPVPEDNEIRIVDLDEERDRAVLRVPGVFFRTLAFSPDGRSLATSLGDGTVRVYDVATGRERLPRPDLRPAVGPPPPEIEASRRWIEAIDGLAFSTDGSALAGVSSLAAVTPSPGSLYLWDLATGRERRRIEGFRVGPTSLAFAPDGRTIATAGSWEPLPRIWDVDTGREAFPQPGHVMGISSIAVSAVDGTVFTGSFDGTVRHWDLATGRELGAIARLNSVLAIAAAPDGKTLLVAGHFGAVLWDVPGHREIRRLSDTLTNGTIQRVALSPDGRIAAFHRQVWDVATGRLLRVLRVADQPEGFIPMSCTMSFTADGRRAIAAEPGVIRTWDVATGAEVAPAVRSERIPGAPAAISADGRFLATGGLPRSVGLAPPMDPWIRVWEAATGREVARMPIPENFNSGVALSPDGRLLASFGLKPGGDRIVYEPQPQDPTIRIWDVASGRERRRLVGHRGIVNAAVFTPDGRSLISAGEDATAMVWDVSDL